MSLESLLVARTARVIYAAGHPRVRRPSRALFARINRDEVVAVAVDGPII